MTPVTIPSLTLEVQDTPLTRAEYAQLDTDGHVGSHGEVTRVVSLDFQLLLDQDSDDAQASIASAVADLGEDWELHAFRVLAADPRDVGTPLEGCRGLFEVTTYPGHDE